MLWYSYKLNFVIVFSFKNIPSPLFTNSPLSLLSLPILLTFLYLSRCSPFWGNSISPRKKESEGWGRVYQTVTTLPNGSIDVREFILSTTQVLPGSLPIKKPEGSISCEVLSLKKRWGRNFIPTRRHWCWIVSFFYLQGSHWFVLFHTWCSTRACS